MDDVASIDEALNTDRVIDITTVGRIEATGRELRKLFAWTTAVDSDYVDGQTAR